MNFDNIIKIMNESSETTKSKSETSYAFLIFLMKKIRRNQKLDTYVSSILVNHVKKIATILGFYVIKVFSSVSKGNRNILNSRKGLNGVN